MKYDFDMVCDRSNTNCSKWDAVENIFGNKDVIPMWVADMDFPVARPIRAHILSTFSGGRYNPDAGRPPALSDLFSRKSELLFYGITFRIYIRCQ